MWCCVYIFLCDGSLVVWNATSMRVRVKFLACTSKQNTLIDWYFVLFLWIIALSKFIKINLYFLKTRSQKSVIALIPTFQQLSIYNVARAVTYVATAAPRNPKTLQYYNNTFSIHIPKCFDSCIFKVNETKLLWN